MSGKDYSKNQPLMKRIGKPGKCISEQLTAFGEKPQLPGGVGTERQFSYMYKPGQADTAGMPLPRSSLSDQ